MDLFPRSFLLVFAQLSVGGFVALSIPPFHEIQRGYYKSSGFVYLLLGGLAVVGRLVLYLGGTGASPVEGLELVFWLLFVSSATAYWATLWSERFVLRARLFVVTWLTGLVALVLAAASYRSAPALSIEAVLYPLSFTLSALALGSVSAGMLLGHWYLIDRDLSLGPLRNMLTVYASCLAIQAGLLLVGGPLLLLVGDVTTERALQTLVDSHAAAFAARVAASPIGAGVLAAMIHRTLQIPQTMAATGLFYIGILAVMVGEFIGRYLLFRTGLPL